MRRLALMGWLAVLLAACGGKAATPPAGALRYLALGDSYTIGTGASSDARNFPSLLGERLAQSTLRQVDVRNLGVNGYTTQD
ncbi:MAG: SGNH/GDSL hydrolase family protein, partial [Candidatus Dormibacteria bacterium]